MHLELMEPLRPTEEAGPNENIRPMETIQLPLPDALESMLDLRFLSLQQESRVDTSALHASLDLALLAPLQDFLQRPGKRLRAELVELGALAAGGACDDVGLRHAEEALEAIHAGSLVVDDIEDESLLRRGEPTLHRRFGLARALNSGNWLYFYPLEKIRHWGLPLVQENALYRLFHSSLLRAHFGQALDVGTSMDQVPQAEVPALCAASLELKSGALTELAISVGAILASEQAEVPGHVAAFGREFGTALQMLDDLGNLQLTVGMESKRFEDLILRRPSWLWACSAQHLSANQYGQWLKCVQALPAAESLMCFLNETQLAEKARTEALAFLKNSVERFTAVSSAETKALVEKLHATLRKAYG